MQLTLSNVTSSILTAAALLLVGCGGGSDSSPSNPTAQQVNLADAMGFYESSLKIDLSKTRSISIGDSAKPSAQVKTLDGTRFSVESRRFDPSEIWFNFYFDDNSEEKPHRIEFMINKISNKIVFGTYYANGKDYMCSDTFSDKSLHCNEKIAVKLSLESNQPLILNFNKASFIGIDNRVEISGELKGFINSKPILIGSTNQPKIELSVNSKKIPINSIYWIKSKENFNLLAKSPDGQEAQFVINNDTLLADILLINNVGYIDLDEQAKIKTERKDGKLSISFSDYGSFKATGTVEYREPRSTLRNEKGSLDLNAREALASHSTFNSLLIKEFSSRPSFGEIDVSILNKKVVAVAYTYPDDQGFSQTVACAPDETPCSGVTVSDDLTTVTFNNTKIGSFNFNGELFSEFF